MCGAWEWAIYVSLSQVFSFLGVKAPLGPLDFQSKSNEKVSNNKGFSSLFYGCSKGSSRVFHGYFRGDLWVIFGYFSTF